MIISNYNNKTIRVQSEYMERLLLSSSSPNITIQAKIGDGTTYSKTIVEQNYWGIDLTDKVASDLVIDSVVFRNINTDKEFQIPIDISLENTSGVIALAIKTAIDDYMVSKGITSDITVTSLYDVYMLEDLPTDFLPISMSFVDEVETQNFTYGDEEDAYFIDSVLCINPSFFVETDLVDGVYTIELTGFDGTEYFNEKNCAFIDVNTKCQVAASLKALISESTNTFVFDKEATATYIHMLHYGLVIGSNCGCNCDNMVSAFTELTALLSTVTTLNTSQNGCGC